MVKINNDFYELKPYKGAMIFKAKEYDETVWYAVITFTRNKTILYSFESLKDLKNKIDKYIEENPRENPIQILRMTMEECLDFLYSNNPLNFNRAAKGKCR